MYSERFQKKFLETTFLLETVPKPFPSGDLIIVKNEMFYRRSLHFFLKPFQHISIRFYRRSLSEVSFTRIPHLVEPAPPSPG